MIKESSQSKIEKREQQLKLYGIKRTPSRFLIAKYIQNQLTDERKTENNSDLRFDAQRS